ncbi:hypothetical protein GGR57DRAFT_509478 [Xylariaceae sp. FL1272]|nr:hypothetical protein GGR57DRAFT_509478 [Xylariaceae sp. FL1272]
MAANNEQQGDQSSTHSRQSSLRAEATSFVPFAAAPNTIVPSGAADTEQRPSTPENPPSEAATSPGTRQLFADLSQARSDANRDISGQSPIRNLALDAPLNPLAMNPVWGVQPARNDSHEALIQNSEMFAGLDRALPDLTLVHPGASTTSFASGSAHPDDPDQSLHAQDGMALFRVDHNSDHRLAVTVSLPDEPVVSPRRGIVRRATGRVRVGAGQAVNWLRGRGGRGSYAEVAKGGLTKDAPGGSHGGRGT